MLWGLIGRKQQELPLPPPAPKSEVMTDIPPITPRDEPEFPSFPEFPELPDTQEIPQLPEPPHEELIPPPIFEIKPQPGVKAEAETPKKESSSFVSMEEFQEIASQANMIRDRLKESERLVKELAEVRTEEEKTFEKWRVLLENLEKKMSYVDTLIAQGEPA